MDPLTVLSTCSLAKDFGLVLAMAMAFSHGEPLTVRSAVDVEDVPLDDTSLEDDDEAPRTREIARAEMRRLKQPLVGLLPVPIGWAARYQHTPDDLLDACVGVSVATAQLSEFERDCNSGGRGARQCALHAYAEAAGIPLFELAVLDSIQEQRLAPSTGDAVIETEEIRGAGIFASDAPDWLKRADSMLVSAELPPTPKKPQSPPRKDKSTKPSEKPNERR